MSWQPRVRAAGWAGQAGRPAAPLSGGRLRALAMPLVEVTATLTVSSGTYVRALAERLGRELGSGGLLLGLTRTRVGPFTAPAPADASAHDLGGEDRDHRE